MNNLSKEDTKVFAIPVSWESCDMVFVRAKCLDDAVEYVMDKADCIPLGHDPQYIDGSYQVNADVAEAFNNENGSTKKISGNIYEVPYPEDDANEVSDAAFVRELCYMLYKVDWKRKNIDAQREIDSINNYYRAVTDWEYESTYETFIEEYGYDHDSGIYSSFDDFLGCEYKDHNLIGSLLGDNVDLLCLYLQDIGKEELHIVKASSENAEMNPMHFIGEFSSNFVLAEMKKGD